MSIRSPKSGEAGDGPSDRRCDYCGIHDGVAIRTGGWWYCSTRCRHAAEDDARVVRLAWERAMGENGYRDNEGVW